MKTELTFEKLKQSNLKRTLKDHELIALIVHHASILQEMDKSEELPVSMRLAPCAEIVILCDSLASTQGFSIENLVEVAFNSRAQSLGRPERL